jgi:hypothetical protein|tara:strand:- start:178 stop:579 length:402 start_codon:yes stop_codon:yes gene_type:complete
MYSQKNGNFNFKIESIDLEGDKFINNYINAQLKKYSLAENEKKFQIKINTDYKKNITAKDLAGAATDFELILNTNVKINRIDDNNVEDVNLTLTDRFNMKKNEDKFEEDSYERLLKINLATSVYEKIIFNLSK